MESAIHNKTKVREDEIGNCGSVEGGTFEQNEPKLITINVSHIGLLQQQQKSIKMPSPSTSQQASVTKILCRSAQFNNATTTVGESLSTEESSTSWMKNPEPAASQTVTPVRGDLTNYQLPPPSTTSAHHSMFPPAHLCYGYVPTCHGFVNNTYPDYLTLDPSLFLRRQKPRTIFSADQLKLLEATFKENSYPSASTRKHVASRVNLPVDRVRVWFQNRRAKEKRLKEDRLAFSLLAGKPPRSGASQSRLHSELLLQKLKELKTHEKQQAMPIDVDNNTEEEDEIVRNLLREARAREEIRNKLSSKNQSSECSAGSSYANCETWNRMTSDAVNNSNIKCHADTPCTTEDQSRQLASKMYAEHIRMLQEAANQANRNKNGQNGVRPIL
eukprot:gene9695-10686_t